MIARGITIAVVVVATVATAGCPSGGGGAVGPTPDLGGGTTGTTGPTGPVVPGKLEDLKGNIVDIAIVGLDDDRTSKAKRALTSAVGSPFSTDTVAADMAALWHQGDVTDVAVDGRVVGTGVGLRYTVKLQPVINAVEVKGATAEPADELVANMPFRRGSPVDPAAFADVRNALIDHFRELGYAHVTVTWETTHHDTGDDVVFTLVEGQPVTIASINFKGNKALKRADLLAALGEDSGPTVGGRYWDLALERNMVWIASKYYDRGYLKVGLDTPEVKPSADGTSVAITLAIKEGPQFKIGKIDFQGDIVPETGDHAKLLAVKAGEVFNRGKVVIGMDKVRQAYATAGYSDVAVNPETKFDDKKHKVDLTIVVTHGPKK